MHPLVQEVQKSELKRVPELKPGYTIRVHQKIKEGNKERVQIFEGLIIKVGHGHGVEKTITVRKMFQGIGVEKIFPIHSPNIAKIEVKKKAKIRRSKLYYMRERSGKSARLQERHVTDQERAEEEARMEAMIQEAVKADEKKQAEVAETGQGAEEATPAAPEAVAAESAAEVAEEPAKEVVEEAVKEAEEAAPVEEKPAEESKEEAPKEEVAAEEKAEEAEAEEKPAE